MKIEKFQIEQILKTLPIGYYAKRNIQISLSDTAEASFYNPMKDEITISVPQLLPVLESLKSTDNLEDDVRAMLYHEVSHAILTPKGMTITNALNIVEDERIETILKKFYMNVDFKSFVKRVNDFHGEAPKTADEAFYQLVRFRIGSEKWLKRLHDLLFDNKDLTSITDQYWKIWGYEVAVKTFYNDFINEFKSEMAKKEENENNDDKQNLISSLNNMQIGESNEEEQEEQEENFSNDSSETDDCDVNIASTVEQTFAKVIDDMRDTEMLEKTKQIFARVTSSTKRNGSSINSYSGAFDPRSVVRDDYKYFTQKNRMGHLKTHSKVHLNLFIDRSGSFCGSQKIVNQLLYSLKELEKTNSDFSFDLVTIGESEKLHAKNDRELECRGGNRVTCKIHEIVKQLQYTSAINYNIVLFDGDAFSDSYDKIEDKDNFKAFNGSNFTIISDSSNEPTINAKCKNSKKIITTKYADQLKINVFKALDQLIR